MNDGDGDRVPSLELRRMEVISALGRGAKGVVFLVKAGGELLALKAISKASIERKEKKVSDDSDGNEYRRIFFEQEVLRRFQHPLLPKLRGVLSTENIVGYAIDYCPGRDLNYLQKKQTEKMFSDDIIRFYAAELVLVLEYLHGLGIVYRDLKPENVMIQESGHLMLVDFDLSTKLSTKQPQQPRSELQSESKSELTKKRRFPSFNRFCNSGISPVDLVHPAESAENSASSELDSASKSNSFVGTEEYVSPEMILGKGHDFAVDWWCFGVVLYEMLYGRTPFRGSNRKETFYRVLTKSPELVGERTLLRDLIGKLLEKDPTKRISEAEIRRHDFFRGVDWDRITQIPRPPFIPSVSDVEEGEDTDGSKGIDLESFVQGVFQADAIADSKNKSKPDDIASNIPSNPTDAVNFAIF